MTGSRAIKPTLFVRAGLTGAQSRARLNGWRAATPARLVAFVLSVMVLPHPASADHAVAEYGSPKYPADFDHFDYVNPNAPKGGSVTLAVSVPNSSVMFDKYNPFNLKGKAAPGLTELVFETLTVLDLDEPNTQYGLLADDIQVAPDFTAATFHINPRARFSNGDPVTAREVKYSFDTLVGKKASPRFKSYFAEIRDVTIVDDHTVRFSFTRAGRDLSFVAGSLPVFSPKWGISDDGNKVSFDQLRLEAPIASGPYLIEKTFKDLTITYRRDPNYWAANLAARRGAFNFDRVIYQLYKDRDSITAALRGGDVDFWPEAQMRYWCCQYIGQRFDSGELVKEKFPRHNLSPMNGQVLNLRKERFQDLRVRQALSYAYDWNWSNDKIFQSEFERQDSYFANSPLAAKGLPSAGEVALLEPYRAELPPAVFGPMVEPPTTKPPSSLRGNLAKAAALFAEAGWTFDEKDGKLKNAQGETFTIEIPTTAGGTSGAGGGGSSGDMLWESFYLNVQKLGVQLIRTSGDAAAVKQKSRNFDFDLTSIAAREARDPVPDLWRLFNSADADVPGSDNVAGVKSHIVDELLNKMANAGSEEELETTAHALDRVMSHNYYVVLPWRYLINTYIVSNSRLKKPEQVPLYYSAYEWLFAAWWDGSATGAKTATR